MLGLYDRTRVSDPQIELMSWSATLIQNSVGETFRKTRANNAEPAHNTYFLGGSATNRLTIAPACHGNELKWSEPRQIVRV